MRFLTSGVRTLVRAKELGDHLADFSLDFRSVVMARAMRAVPGGRGDICYPGPLAPGPALGFGATPLEFMRQVGQKGTTPAAARTGGSSWTDLRMGLIGWDGPPGTMTQVIAGAGLAFRQRGEDRAALVFEEVDAIETGGWHEGINLAAVQKVPVIVVLVVKPAWTGASAARTDTRASHIRDPGAGDQVPRPTPLRRFSTRRPPPNCLAYLARIQDLATGYGASALSLGDSSAAELYQQVAAARQRAVNGEGPTLMEFPPQRQDGPDLHEGLLELARSEAGLKQEELTEVERAARVAVEHAVGRLGKEPGPRTRDALVPVLTDLPVVAPWTRLTPPTPADRTPVEVGQ